MRQIAVIVIAVALTASLVIAQASRTAEVQLKAAQYKEEVEGDLKGALSDYKKLADGKDRSVAANALLRMAGIYRKQGDAEAKKVYERVLAKYSDQKDAVAEAQASLRALENGGSAGFAHKDLTLVSTTRWDEVTPDGRYLLSTSLRVRDLVTGQERVIDGANTTEPASSIVPSPDSRHVAYGALISMDAEKNVFELRTLSLQGTMSKVVTRTDEFYTVSPFGWSPDGKEIFVMLARRNGTRQIVAVTAANGSMRALKEIERRPEKLSLSPDARHIAYSAPVDRDSANRDIFLLSLDGSGAETSIVSHPSRDTQPVWTPDGKAIVFASDRSGTDGFWLVRVQGGRAVATPELLKDKVDLPVPVGVARNGTFYYRTGDTSGRDVYVSEIDLSAGTIPRSIPRLISGRQFRSSTPAFSPDGKRIAYFGEDGATLGGIPTTLTGSLFFPTRLFFRRESILVIHSLETGEEREIRGLPGPQSKPDARVGQVLVWFPDGQSIVFLGEDSSLYWINVNSGQTLVQKSRVSENTWGLSVSPDGKRIFYTNPAGGSDRLLVAYDVEAQRDVELFKGVINPLDLCISPDGQWIALRLGSPEAAGVNLIPASGGPSKRVFASATNHENHVSSPKMWSSDGTKLLIQDLIDGQLWWVPSNGGNPQPIGADAFPTIESISPDGRLIAHTQTTPSSSLAVWADQNVLLPDGQARGILTAQITRDGSKISGPVTPLTQSTVVWELQPTWSPDGKSIAFRQGHPDSSYDLIVRSLETGKERIYSRTGGNMAGTASWLHDGRAVLTSVLGTEINQGRGSVFRVELESAEFRDIGAEIRNTNPQGRRRRAGFAALSSNDRVFYNPGRDAGSNSNPLEHILAIDTASWKQSEIYTVPGGGSIIELVLSPDDRTLALLIANGSEYHLAKVGVDGRGFEVLDTSVGGSSRMLSWTGDGRAILFGQFESGRRTEARVMRITAAGGKPTFTGLTLKRVTAEDTIRVSPEGTRILFSGNLQSVSITDPKAAR